MKKVLGYFGAHDEAVSICKSYMLMGIDCYVMFEEELDAYMVVTEDETMAIVEPIA